jgi:hypothetical protein
MPFRAGTIVRPTRRLSEPAPSRRFRHCRSCFTLSMPALTHSSSTPGEPDNPAPPIADLDRHPAVDGDNVRQRGLLAAHRPRFHLVDESLRRHPESARGICLAPRILHRVGFRIVSAQRDHRVAASIDDDHGNRVTSRLAGLDMEKPATRFARRTDTPDRCNRGSMDVPARPANRSALRRQHRAFCRPQSDSRSTARKFAGRRSPS